MPNGAAMRNNGLPDIRGSAPATPVPAVAPTTRSRSMQETVDAYVSHTLIGQTSCGNPEFCYCLDRRLLGEAGH